LATGIVLWSILLLLVRLGIAAGASFVPVWLPVSPRFLAGILSPAAAAAAPLP
jgi:hypothetical protein